MPQRSIYLLLLIGSACLPAQDSGYWKESPRVFDGARLIEPGKFNTSDLRNQFAEAQGNLCKGRQLARLTVSPSQHDLSAVLNATYLDLTPQSERWFASEWAKSLGSRSHDIRVAQLLCFGGAATMTVRDGRRLHGFQISGPHDSREWVVNGVDVIVVGFRFSSPETPLLMFLQTQALPPLDKSAAIRDRMQGLAGVPTAVVIRTDPFFWTSNGPQYDYFRERVRSISAEEFLKERYVVCPPSESKNPCRMEAPGESKAAEQPRR